MDIDGSVSPDVDVPPRSLDSPEARADYVHRIPPGLHASVPKYVEYDRLEGRGEDPCEFRI